MSFLEISGVSKSYGENATRTDVLDDINLKVEEGGREKLYSAVYIAVLTPEGWRLDGGTFKTL